MEECRVFSFTNKENYNKAYVILNYMDDHYVQVKGKAKQILFNAIGKPDNQNNISFEEEANGRVFKDDTKAQDFIDYKRQSDYDEGIGSYNLGNLMINVIDNTVYFHGIE